MTALRICIEPGCPTVTPNRRCPTHETQARVTWRTPNTSFYNSKRWRTTSRNYLRQHPWCEDGCGEPATEVNHITPLEDGGPPYDWHNLEALTKACHSRKTAQQVWHTNRTG